MGWSFTLGFAGETIGGIMKGQWFPAATGTAHVLGAGAGLRPGIGIGAVAAALVINLLGIRIAASFRGSHREPDMPEALDLQAQGRPPAPPVRR
jgi:hypothetical protein